MMFNEITRLLEELDKEARRRAYEAYVSSVSRWSANDLAVFIDKVTGGLGYTGKEPLDAARMGLAGSVIAWAEVVEQGSLVLEIGTGIGRTCYAATYSVEPKLYVTIDSSAEMLAVALYSNPVEEYSKCLGRPFVRIINDDALHALNILPEGFFTHIIHDGGPNPLRNPRLYSYKFLEMLIAKARPGARISVFAGRHRAWQDRIYRRLRRLGVKVVESVHLPWSRALVIHGIVEERVSPGNPATL